MGQTLNSHDMMKSTLIRKVLLVTGLLLVALSVSAQTSPCQISGVVMDSVRHEAIAYATIEYKLLDEQLTGGAVSNEQGHFEMTLPRTGSYQLTIRSVGFLTRQMRVTTQAGQNSLDTIYIAPDTQTLDEVQVVARRKLIKLSPKGLTYDMKNDVLAQTDNLLFALRKVPLVTVDGEGNIRVKGSSNFSVYINGSPSRVASMNPTEVLRGIPASSVKGIEVITQVDARYDASAGDAIINIITESKSLDGYSGLVSLMGSTIPNINGTSSLTLTKGKLSVALNYNYDYTRHKDQPVDISRRTFQGDKTTSLFKSTAVAGSNNDGVFQNHVGSLMGEYAIDSLNSLYADGHLFVSSVYSTGLSQQTFDRPNEPTRYATSLNQMRLTSGSVEGNLIYRNLYAADKQPRFSIGYRYAYNPDQRYKEWTERQYRDGFTNWENSPYDETRRMERSRGGLSEHALQSDYQFIWSGGHALQVGVKEVLRLGSSRPEYHLWNEGKGDWQEVNNPLYRQGDMSQLQSLTSAYANYAWQGERFALSAGARGTLVYDKITFSQNSEGDFHKTGIDLIPTATLSYMLTDRQQLFLSYKMSPIRPSIWRLNPYRSQVTTYDISFGNPYLQSELHHNVDLSYTFFSNQLYLSLTTGYEQTNNAIMSVRYRDPKSPEILYHTFANAGLHRVPNASLWMNWRPIMPLSLTFFWSCRYHLFDYPSEGLSQRNWENMLSANVDVTLPKSWYLGASWYYYANPPTLRTTYSYSHGYSFYLKKSFWDDKLDLTLTAQHPFSKYIRFETKQWGDDFEYNQRNMIQARAIGLKITYNFNSGKSRKVTRNESLATSDLDQRTGVQ